MPGILTRAQRGQNPILRSSHCSLSCVSGPLGDISRRCKQRQARSFAPRVTCSVKFKIQKNRQEILRVGKQYFVCGDVGWSSFLLQFGARDLLENLSENIGGRHVGRSQFPTWIMNRDAAQDRIFDDCIFQHATSRPRRNKHASHGLLMECESDDWDVSSPTGPYFYDARHRINARSYRNFRHRETCPALS